MQPCARPFSWIIQQLSTASSLAPACVIATGPTFFSVQDSGLIREFKALSSTGVLRLRAIYSTGSWTVVVSIRRR
jgi:hypothetical protein